MIDLVVVSSFDWSAPGTPELFSETASLAGIKTIHFTKPNKIFTRSKETPTDLNFVKTERLKIISARLSKNKILDKMQSKLVISQILREINNNKIYKHKPKLIYTNLEAISGILPMIKKYFSEIYYICADYSDLGVSFHQNALYADKILTIPESMVDRIEEEYPGKTILWPQMTSYYEKGIKESECVRELLKKIPKPRALYSGVAATRLDMRLYKNLSSSLPDVSFITFTNDKIVKRNQNRYEIPWLSKSKLMSFINECDIGFMPYDIKFLHNLHCVPLKLFEYLEAGLPVVSSKLLNLKSFHPHVYLANDEQEFIRMLKFKINNGVNEEEKKKIKSLVVSHRTINNTDKLCNLLNLDIS